MSEKDTQSNNMPWKVDAIVRIVMAVIGVVGTIGVAVATNWDKFNSSKTEQSPTNQQSETASNQNTQNISKPTSLPSSNTSLPHSIPGETYYVIAGSSEYRDELAKVPVIAAGNEYYNSFPNIKICPSKIESNIYYLVLGSELSKSDADALKQQAINNRFDKKTYVSESNQIQFSIPSCKSIVDIKK